MADIWFMAVEFVKEKSDANTFTFSFLRLYLHSDTPSPNVVLRREIRCNKRTPDKRQST